MVRRQGPPPAADEDFPELEATFMAAPTRMAPDTRVLPREGDASTPGTLTLPVPARSPAARRLMWGAAAAAVLAVVAGAFLVARAGREETRRPSGGGSSAGPGKAPPQPGSETARPPDPPPPAPHVRLTVVSDPPGAAVLVDGAAVAGVTPLEVLLEPGREHRLKLQRDGHVAQEVSLGAGGWPAEVRVVLQPSGPLGRVNVVSAYPVDAVWQGRVLSKGQPTAQLSLPAGRQVLTLVAPAHFLRMNVTADVRADGVTAVEAPPLGRINIRANPDNCQVFIDGAFVDYPPILDRAIAVGRHRVSFTWPDGGRYEETADVARGAPAYVMGRRD
jgi:PEGA domain-containing protein